MLITPAPHGLDLLVSDLVRSPGLHMSTIYGKLFQELEPKRYRGEIEQANPLLLALGTAWERHLEFILGQNGLQVVRPGELQSADGRIAYSPDGIWEDRLIEYKLSSMGSKDLPHEPCTKLPPKFDKYVCQMASYCYHLGTPKARLYFCSIYRPHDPELVVYDIEFSARELHDNWRMMSNYAKSKGLL